MKVGPLLAAILRDAEAEIERVAATADAEVESIHSRAAIDAERAAREARASRDPQLRSEVDRRRAIADVDVASIERAAVEDARRATDAELRRLLAARRDGPDYGALLAALLAEAASVADLRLVRVDPMDAAIMADVAASMGLDVEVRPDLGSIGGLEAETSDGRRVVNTLEERLRNAEPVLREALATHFERLLEVAAQPIAHRSNGEATGIPAGSRTASPATASRTRDGGS